MLIIVLLTFFPIFKLYTTLMQRSSLSSLGTILSSEGWSLAHIDMLANQDEWGTDGIKYEKKDGREELGINIKDMITYHSHCNSIRAYFCCYFEKVVWWKLSWWILKCVTIFNI